MSRPCASRQSRVAACREGCAREVVEPQPEHDRPAHAHAAGDPVDQAEQAASSSSADLRERPRARCAPIDPRRRRAWTGPWIPVRREGVDVPSRGPPEHGHQGALRERGHLADGRDPDLMQPAVTAPTPQSRSTGRAWRNASSRSGCTTSRPSASRRRSPLSRGTSSSPPDRDRQADPLAHVLPQPHDRGGATREPPHPTYVEERLVDRHAFDERCRVLEDPVERLARLDVRGHPAARRRRRPGRGGGPSRLPWPYEPHTPWPRSSPRARLPRRRSPAARAGEGRLAARPTHRRSRRRRGGSSPRLTRTYVRCFIAQCSSRSTGSTASWTRSRKRAPLSTADGQAAVCHGPSLGRPRLLAAHGRHCGDSRIVCTGTTVSLAGAHEDPLLEEAEFVVFDLETTGLSGARDRICEVGAARVRALELVDSFQSLVNPRVAPSADNASDRTARARVAPSTPVSSVIKRFIAFAGDATLAAHNARFDQRFLERQLQWLHGRRLPSRLSAPPRSPGACSRDACAASASPRSPTSSAPTRPCHRAPDAESTAQVLVCLIGLAQEWSTPGLRPAQARSSSQAARVRQASARARRTRSARRLSLPRQVGPGALRGARPRPARPLALLLPERTPAPVGRGGPAWRSSESSGVFSAPSWKLRSRSCG